MVEDFVKSLKKHTTNWEKIVTIHLSDKWFACRIINKLLQLIIKNMDKRFEQMFSQRRYSFDQ